MSDYYSPYRYEAYCSTGLLPDADVIIIDCFDKQTTISLTIEQAQEMVQSLQNAITAALRLKNRTENKETV